MKNGRLHIKSGKWSFLLGLAVAGVLLFASCQNILDLASAQPQDVGYGKVVIDLGGSGGRTAFPGDPSTGKQAPDFDRYEYYFDVSVAGLAAAEPATPDPNDSSFTLKAGPHTVIVLAFMDGTEDALAQSELVSFNVQGGSLDIIRVYLAPKILGEGQGKLAYTITYPADADASVTLEKWERGDVFTNATSDLAIPITKPPLVSGQNQYKNTVDLHSGYYLLTVKVTKTDGTKRGGVSQVVQIFDSHLTNFDQEIAEADLIAINTPEEAVKALYDGIDSWLNSRVLAYSQPKVLTSNAAPTATVAINRIITLYYVSGKDSWADTTFPLPAVLPSNWVLRSGSNLTVTPTTQTAKTIILENDKFTDGDDAILACTVRLIPVVEYTVTFDEGVVNGKTISVPNNSILKGIGGTVNGANYVFTKDGAGIAGSFITNVAIAAFNITPGANTAIHLADIVATTLYTSAASIPTTATATSGSTAVNVYLPVAEQAAAAKSYLAAFSNANPPTWDWAGEVDTINNNSSAATPNAAVNYIGAAIDDGDLDLGDDAPDGLAAVAASNVVTFNFTPIPDGITTFVPTNSAVATTVFPYRFTMTRGIKFTVSFSMEPAPNTASPQAASITIRNGTSNVGQPFAYSATSASRFVSLSTFDDSLVFAPNTGYYFEVTDANAAEGDEGPIDVSSPIATDDLESIHYNITVYDTLANQKKSAIATMRTTSPMSWFDADDADDTLVPTDFNVVNPPWANVLDNSAPDHPNTPTDETEVFYLGNPPLLVEDIADIIAGIDSRWVPADSGDGFELDEGVLSLSFLPYGSTDGSVLDPDDDAEDDVYTITLVELAKFSLDFTEAPINSRLTLNDGDGRFGPKTIRATQSGNALVYLVETASAEDFTIESASGNLFEVCDSAGELTALDNSGDREILSMDYIIKVYPSQADQEKVAIGLLSDRIKAWVGENKANLTERLSVDDLVKHTPTDGIDPGDFTINFVYSKLDAETDFSEISGDDGTDFAGGWNEGDGVTHGTAWVIPDDPDNFDDMEPIALVFILKGQAAIEDLTDEALTLDYTVTLNPIAEYNVLFSTLSGVTLSGMGSVTITVGTTASQPFTRTSNFVGEIGTGTTIDYTAGTSTAITLSLSCDDAAAALPAFNGSSPRTAIIEEPTSNVYEIVVTKTKN